MRVFAFGSRKVEQVRVKLQILPDRQLGIERERLRHIADPIARLQIAGIERPAEQQRFAFAGRQQPGQHLHRRRLAAAVRADKAEDLAAFDREADMIDRGEIAEAAGEVARNDHRLGLDGAARRDLQRVVAGALGLRQHVDEGRLDRAGSGGLFEHRRRPGSDNLAIVHRHEPVEALGLLHVRGRDQDAHPLAARPHPIDQFPELAARQRVDAGGRLVEDQEIRVMDQRTAKPELLPHATRQLLRRAAGERREAGAVEQLGDARSPVRRGIARTGGQRTRCSPGR